MKIHELFQDPAKHCKHHFALNPTGLAAKSENGRFGVSADAPDAVSWCLSGAVERFYPSHLVGEKVRRLYEAMASLHPICGKSLIAWNDDEATTVEMVREVAKLADV